MAEAKSKKPKKGKTEIDEKRFPKKVRRRQQLPRGKHGGLQLMLVENVEHLGKQGDVVEVKPGYGRNYLLPNGLATFVTPEALRRIETHKAKVEALRIARLNDLKMLARKIEEQSVTIEANANEEGHLYGSVTETDIAKALQKANFDLKADHIKLEGHLKELGLYNVKLVLEEEITAELKVWVVPSSEK
ncbi:50S ribosomal protein L9 [bacterium]|nr:50S ribosomal protein L9 [bacterium]